MHYMFHQDLKQWNGIVNSLRDVYNKNKKPSDRYYEICCKYSRRCKWVVKCVFHFGIGAYIMILLITLISAQSGEMRPCAYVYLPRPYEYPTLMLVALHLFNFASLTFLLVIFCGDQAMVCMLFLNMPMVSSIIAEHLMELNNIIQQENNKTMEIKREMIEYYWMHRKYKE